MPPILSVYWLRFIERVREARPVRTIGHTAPVPPKAGSLPERSLAIGFDRLVQLWWVFHFLPRLIGHVRSLLAADFIVCVQPNGQPIFNLETAHMGLDTPKIKKLTFNSEKIAALLLTSARGIQGMGAA